MRVSSLLIPSLASFVVMVISPSLQANPLDKQAQRQVAAETKGELPAGMPKAILTVNDGETVKLYAMEKVEDSFRPEALKGMSKEERTKTEAQMVKLYTTKQNLIDEVSAKNSVDRVAGSGTNAWCRRGWGWGGYRGYWDYGYGRGYYGGWGGSYCGGYGRYGWGGGGVVVAGGGYCSNWGGYGAGYCGGCQPWSVITYTPVYTTTYVTNSCSYGLGYGFNNGNYGFGVYYN